MDHVTFSLQRAASYLELLLSTGGFVFLKPQHLSATVLVAGRAAQGLVLVLDWVEQAPSAEPAIVPPELAFLPLPAERIAVQEQQDPKTQQVVLTLFVNQALMDLFPKRKAREFGIEIALLP